MRQVVAGVRGKGAGGVQQLNVWFRFPVPVARQPYYASMNSAYTPQAPDSNGGKKYDTVDAPNGINDPQEIVDIRAGKFAENPSFAWIVDPTETDAQTAQHILNVYNSAAAQVLVDDTAALKNYATYYDGSWHLKNF